MSEVRESQLTEMLSQFEAANQVDQAISICSRFLRKREILKQPESQQSESVQLAIARRDRTTLRDYEEFSIFPDIRDCAKAVRGQIDAKTAPVSKWPTL